MGLILKMISIEDNLKKAEDFYKKAEKEVNCGEKS